VEDATEDYVGGDTEEDRERKEPVYLEMLLDRSGGSDVIGSEAMAMAGDPGHGLAFFHSGVFLFLPTSLLYTST